MNKKILGASVFAVATLTAGGVASADSLTVKSGDTLWSLAKANNISLDNLKKVNNLKSNTIYPGQKLKLSTSSSSNEKSEASVTSHTVKNGDTLWAISNKYHISVSQLKSINKLQKDIIYPGQKLVVSKKVDGNSNTSPSQKPDKESGSKAENKYYTVKSGDTLWKISSNNKISLADLKSWNNIKNNLIFPGDKLIVSKGTSTEKEQQVVDKEETGELFDYTVLYGDSLSKIAFKYNTTVSKIKKANNMSDATIYPNQKIKIDVSQVSSLFINPAEGTITSNFGPRSGRNHNGIDIAKSGDVDIIAAANGIVTQSYTSTSYGEVIFVEHNINGQVYETVYAHMREDSRKYSVGDKVKTGDVIGKMGNTGNSSGQHLHFEVHKGKWNGEKTNAVNPILFIK